ncbi:hypothetical protein AmaxDRAFT_5203 [Limnospira maxima CS-328]|uniref:Uncharacterized protein n=1 Tax=Limnospira maxima CS-328 TaxID=513049 RepID=B5W8V3_LIMMA|nr:hypothetical protein AmaxDRAFT_5203 [Limnospira maxima CS-328]UWU46438.1 hypothetical protein APLC1_1149 [Arthrospira platensis C1]
MFMTLKKCANDKILMKLPDVEPEEFDKLEL